MKPIVDIFVEFSDWGTNGGAISPVRGGGIEEVYIWKRARELEGQTLRQRCETRLVHTAVQMRIVQKSKVQLTIKECSCISNLYLILALDLLPM